MAIPKMKTVGLANLKGLCGIYKIECTETGKFYIGSSDNLHRRRREHYSDLRQNIHINPKLQHAWNKYGESKFYFTVLEVCSVKDKFDREQWWLDVMECYKQEKGYNISLLSTHGSYPFRSVACLNTEEVFESIKDGAEKYGLNTPNIIACCKGISRACGTHPETKERLIWMYKEEYLKINPNERQQKKEEIHRSMKVKKIVCINTGEVYNNMPEAGEWASVSQSQISFCCNRKIPAAGKHPTTGERLGWMFLHDYEKLDAEGLKRAKEKIKINPKQRKVICLTTLEVFDGVRVAEAQTGACKVSECCSGKRKTVGKHPKTGEGLRWMYYDEYLKI